MRSCNLLMCMVVSMLSGGIIASRQLQHLSKVQAASTGKQSVSVPAQERKPDYSDQPWVTESFVSHVRFENDGRAQRNVRAHVRVQSEAGVQQFGQLVFEYDSGTEKIEITYVRVQKVDGTVVTARAEGIQDMTSAVAREAPVYTDLREKHVSVPALAPGDAIEYEIRISTHTPLAPGQFWYEHSFLKDGIVLDEQLEMNMPAGREIKLKSAEGLEAAMREENGRRIYLWKHKNLEVSEKKEESSEDAEEETIEPDVQLTTFRDWAEVGAWYGGLAKPRAKVTPEIQARAERLLAGKSSAQARAEVLYRYVAQSVRYVSLSFGVGRYQPHAAAEVLANQYGDCKDIHTLLAAMLSATGTEGFPALISSRKKLDPDVPSPAQFDHVITAMPMGTGLMWMDATLGVAPAGMLPVNLRDKLALVILDSGPARLEKTPADPPFPSTQRVEVRGTVSPLGKLTARVKYTVRGDNELMLRRAFRGTPKNQWKDLARLLAFSDGLRGDIASVSASDPADTSSPFELEYEVGLPGFLDGSSKQIQLPLPMPGIGMPPAEGSAASSQKLIELGTPLDVLISLQLEVPDRFTFQAPIGIGLKRDYAEYRSRYRIEGKTLIAERAMHFLARTLPAGQSAEYRAFQRAVRADENQTLSLKSEVAGNTEVDPSTSAEELYEAALAASKNFDYARAVKLLEQTVEKDPKHKTAWNKLGEAYAGVGKYDEAVSAYHEQIKLTPHDELAYNSLGLALRSQKKNDKAIAALEKGMEINPLDPRCVFNLGILYKEEKEYVKAQPLLDKAGALLPSFPPLLLARGEVYLNVGEREKALEFFERAVERMPSPTVWNTVAYHLALNNLELDRAQQYAESAVAMMSAAARNQRLDAMPQMNFISTGALAAYWDTLGWVHFKKGNLPRAERFVRAAWIAEPLGEVADHLGQIFEKQGKREEAARAYAQALIGDDPPKLARENLVRLAGGIEEADKLVALAGKEFAALRTVSLGAWSAEGQEAGYLVLVGAGGRVEELKPMGEARVVEKEDALRHAAIRMEFPDETPTRLVIFGVIACDSAARTCEFRRKKPRPTTLSFSSGNR